MAPKGHVLKAWASEMLGSEEILPNKRSLGHWSTLNRSVKALVLSLSHL